MDIGYHPAILITTDPVPALRDIKPPKDLFYFGWWFILLLVLIFSGLILFILYKRKKDKFIKENEAIEEPIMVKKEPIITEDLERDFKMKKKKGIDSEIEKHDEIVNRMKEEIKKVIVGQDAMIEKALIGLFSRGHIILEGMPGLAKTLFLKTLSQIVDTSFNRIQFTPDLLPADLIGTRIYDKKRGRFYTRKGPIFANLILADEINRAPAKVQSALLEAMEEKQVTIGDETFKLNEPFMVMATQNPIEGEGTYRLPEAQLDRFMLKIKIGYPSYDDEGEIVKRMTTGRAIKVNTVTLPDEILKIRKVVDDIYVDEVMKKYILNIVFATRKVETNGIGIEEYIQYGASPRASIYLTTTAKTHAFLRGRGYVMPEDIKAIASEVLRHRIILTYEAESEGVTTDQLIGRLLEKVEVA